MAEAGLARSRAHRPDGSRRPVLVNAYGAVRGGIVRVHDNVVVQTLRDSRVVFVANAPRESTASAAAIVLSAQGSSRLRSLLADAVSRGPRRFEWRIDTAPAFRLWTRADRHTVLVHDLNFLSPRIHSISAKQRVYRWLLHRWTLRVCDEIIAFSSQTRDEITAFSPRAAAKTRVVRLPVTDLADRVDDVRAPGPFSSDDNMRVLTFGHAANKGVEHLLAALAADPGLSLTVVCSPEEWDRLWEARAQALSVRHRVRVTGVLSDAELVETYRDSTVFCMLSHYEGFGLPAAEALLLGVPTVVSDLDVLAETTRGYARAVDPTQTDLLLAAIRTAAASDPDQIAEAAGVIGSWTWDDWFSEVEGAFAR